VKRFLAVLAFVAFSAAFVVQANARTVTVTFDDNIAPQLNFMVVSIEMGTYVTGGIAVTTTDLGKTAIKKVVDCRSDTGKYIVTVTDATNKIMLWTAANTQLANATDLTDESVTCTILTGSQSN